MTTRPNSPNGTPATRCLRSRGIYGSGRVIELRWLGSKPPGRCLPDDDGPRTVIEMTNEKEDRLGYGANDTQRLNGGDAASNAVEAQDRQPLQAEVKRRSKS
jgi:hypothetical protein